MGDLLKINISLDTDIKELLSNADRESLALELGNEYSILARQAYQAKVPVNTEELRNSILRDVTVSPNGAKCRIYLPNRIHQESPYPTLKYKPVKKKLTLDQLAQDLDEGSYTRSQTSFSDIGAFSPVPGGTTTEGWEELAFSDFEASLG